MSLLFTPGTFGTLTLANRLVRSATAERMADDEGRPRPELARLYRDLARGGVGLIITGHMYVHPAGRCHLGMTGIYDDALIPGLAALVDAVHCEGGKIAVQINHGGMQCARESVAGTIAPSAMDAPFLPQPAREMALNEIEGAIDAYAQAARRAQIAGFDAVQIHGAHGYLINQFLSPFGNRRTDGWGGDLEGRMRFLRAVCAAVRAQVGPDYPLFIKFGMMDGIEGGLMLHESLRVVAAMADMGLDAIELSGGITAGAIQNSKAGVRNVEDEAYFRHFAKAARPVTSLPLMLVGGFRSRQVMDDVLASGDVDFISLCRPLIAEPDLPNRLQQGQARSACISGNRCWPKEAGEGIACRCLK
ncbi:MAG TPA: NADH:flavin oxidoreductase [Anaerolineae bacterium]|nr:NADH:flavin oxidoreductase [Anaerolineae bacterium]HQI86321.1 NADH:flavin oxidoreductase [Anaerolineae bacterium]